MDEETGVIPNNTIQNAIDALAEVLNIHENHLYPQDFRTLTDARERLLVMRDQGFK